jgi:ribosome maturation factor RimP
MRELINKITDIIKPVFETGDIYLVDIELKGKGKNQLLRIYADTERGISLSQITQLNNEISDLLDMNNIIPGAYRLEISSPGLDRPLKYLWQYKKNIDRYVQVHYWANENRKEITGKLKSANNQEIKLELKKEELKIPFSAIIRTKVRVSI